MLRRRGAPSRNIGRQQNLFFNSLLDLITNV